MQVIAAPPRIVYVRPRGSRIESTLLGLAVIVLAALAALGGFAAARYQAPTQDEIIAAQRWAESEAYRRGTLEGMAEGRAQTREFEGAAQDLKTRNKQWQEWNRGYRAGRRAARSSSGSRSSRYRGGAGIAAPRPRISMSAPSASSFSYEADIAPAREIASDYANLTNSTVGVDIY